MLVEKKHLTLEDTSNANESCMIFLAEQFAEDPTTQTMI